MPLCSFMTTATDTAATVTTLSATVAALSATVDDHSAALSCDSSGRRLAAPEAADELPATPPTPTANAVLQEYLSRNPGFAEALTAEQQAHFIALGQDFGLPALAQGE